MIAASLPRPALSFPAAVAAMLAGSIALHLAFPGYSLWWTAPIGVALQLLALRGRRLVVGGFLGFVGGSTFYLLHVSWTSLFLGPVPWIALSTLMGAWWALGALGICIAYRRVLAWGGRFRTLGILPIVAASIWTFREWLASNVPYGGFAWGRIAQSQSNSPLLELVSWVGFSGLCFLLVWWVAFALEVAVGWCRLRQIHAAPRCAGWCLRVLAGVFGVLAAAVTLLVWPLWVVPQGNTVRVLAVQGDTPGASYFIPSRPGEVMTAHADATLEALDSAGRVDLVLWPEGSVDVSPLLNDSAAQLLEYVQARAGAPLLINTVTMDGDWDDPATKYFNSQLVWQNGQAGQQYDKAHPIPFGEYVPDREFFAALAPDLIGLIGREYTPGTRANVLQLGGVNYGVFICYDIVDDHLLRSAVQDGAQVLLAPSNNADFGRSDESAQQLATARLRAVESGRAVIQASTVGWSAAFRADGTQIAGLDWYKPGAFVADVATANGQTPATQFGVAIDVIVCGIGVALVLATPRRRS